MNTMLMQMPVSSCIDWYNRFNILAFFAGISLLLFLSKERNRAKMVLCFIAAYASISIFNYIDQLILGQTDLIRFYKGVLMGSLIGYLFFFRSKKNRLYAQDILLVSLLMFRIFSCIACMFTGCCTGFRNEWGIYSHVKNTICFPTLQIEFFLTLILLVYLLTELFRVKTYYPGQVISKGLFLYGIIAFVSDLTRGNTKMFGMSSFDSLIAFFMIIVALIIYYQQNKHYPNIYGHVL